MQREGNFSIIHSPTKATSWQLTNIMRQDTKGVETKIHVPVQFFQDVLRTAWRSITFTSDNEPRTLTDALWHLSDALHQPDSLGSCFRHYIADNFSFSWSNLLVRMDEMNKSFLSPILGEIPPRDPDMLALCSGASGFTHMPQSNFKLHHFIIDNK